ncbi:amidinotransferase [Candidatus Omnitrophota bacterium]
MKAKVANSHNEWDPLEEIIVGNIDGACVMSWEKPFEALTPPEILKVTQGYRNIFGGTAVQKQAVEQAQKDLDNFIHVLESEGVIVRRPDAIDNSKPYATPYWAAKSGYNQKDPRDVLMVVGDHIIESTMSWKCRYFENFAYRSLVKEYFKKGARWSVGPKPMLIEQLYDPKWKMGNQRYITNEFEPIIDVADAVRCGRDIFVQRSQVTNDFGIEWLRRTLGSEYTVHKLEFDDPRALHIDATFLPLAPGKLLVNPARPIKKLPKIFKKAKWEILECPETTYPKSQRTGYLWNQWLHMNMLNLDEKRLIVEKEEGPLIQALKNWGFQPIPLPFRSNYSFGGSFHCATCDIRRRGELRSYF